MSGFNIGVIGAGLMGHGIAYLLAAVGHTVRICNATRVALAEATEKPYSRLRRISGIAVLAVIELALIAVLAVAGWRLVEGYITRAYVDGAFATNFFLLLGLIILLGILGLSTVFPRACSGDM